MAQAEIIEFLKECDEPVTRRQIAEGLEADPIVISKALACLLKYKEVEFIEHPRERASELVGYMLLRRTRFFFVIKE